MHQRAAHGVGRGRLGQPVDGAEPEQQRAAQEVRGPAGRERAQRPGGSRPRSCVPSVGRRTDRASRQVDWRACPSPRRRPAPRPPGTFRIGTLAGTDVLVSSTWFVVAGLIAVLVAPRIEQVAARPRRAQVRRRAGVRGDPLPLGAAARGVARLHGPPLRLPGHLDHAALPRRHDRDRRRGAQGRARSSGSPSSARSPRSPSAAAAVGLWFVTPGRPAAGGRRGPGRRQPARRRPQPGPGTAARRRPGAQGGGVGRDRRPAPRHHRRGLGRPGRGRRSCCSGRSPRSALLGQPPDIVDFVLAFVIALFLWTGATAAINAARVRRRLPVLVARDLARRTLAVPDDLPLAEAVRRAQEAEAGGIVTVDQRRRARRAWSTRPPSLATPEDRRPWVADLDGGPRRWTTGLRLPVDISGEDLVRAISRTPADGVPPGRAGRLDLRRARPPPTSTGRSGRPGS